MEDKLKMADSEKVYSPSEAQRRFCNAHAYPWFAPIRYCPKCHRDIYGSGGYSLDYAATHLITGCPFCHWSYCE